jgi:hypothetical protein
VLFVQQQGCDQKAAQDEKYVDADIPVQEGWVWTNMIEDGESNAYGTKAIELRSISHRVWPQAGRLVPVASVRQHTLRIDYTPE